MNEPRKEETLEAKNETTLQTPSIGRIVHYKAYGSPGGEHKSEPRAAIVTEVFSDQCVSLCVINPTGTHFNRGVLYGDGPGQWSWPPYVPAKK